MSVKNNHLEKLLEQGHVWRGDRAAISTGQYLPSGVSGLDAHIGGGWPRAALVEILSTGGVGLSLLVPVLARLSREPAWQSWINPPHVPFAPALLARGIDTTRVLLVRNVDGQQALWAAEQALRAATSSAVLLWATRVTAAQLRRLQLAAASGSGLAVLFRAVTEAAQPSPAALRLLIHAEVAALQVQVLKRRGGWAGDRVQVPR